MKRREFLASSAVGIAALLMGINGCKDQKNDFTKKNLSTGKLAGLTLDELQERHRYYLFDDYLPFLEKYVVDHEYGGPGDRQEMAPDRLD